MAVNSRSDVSSSPSECCVTPFHGAAIARPAERIVLSEISGRDARSSNHSASPITPQLRAFTNSATRDFLLMRGTVIPGYVGAMFREGIREVVPAGAISLGDE